MVLVVLAFVVLTAAAMLDAYGPCVGHAHIGKAAGCFIGLLAFFFLVSLSPPASKLIPSYSNSGQLRSLQGLVTYPTVHVIDGSEISVLPAQVVMLLWSYFSAFLTEPGKIPAGWSPFASDEVRFLNYSLLTQTC